MHPNEKLVLLPGLLCDEAIWTPILELLNINDYFVADYGELVNLAAMAKLVLTQVEGDQLIEVFKDPITDRKKSSKKGRLDVIFNTETQKLETVVINALPLGEYHPQTVMETVFHNGTITKRYHFDAVRTNEKRYAHQFKSGVEHIANSR